MSARVRAEVRSTETGPFKIQEKDASVYDDGHLRVEHDNYYVSCEDEEVTLLRKEFFILSLLARHHDRIVMPEEIWRHAWSTVAPMNHGTFRVHMHRLRKRLEPFNVQIVNKVNQGYVLVPASHS